MVGRAQLHHVIGIVEIEPPQAFGGLPPRAPLAKLVELLVGKPDRQSIGARCEKELDPSVLAVDIVAVARHQREILTESHAPDGRQIGPAVEDSGGQRIRPGDRKPGIVGAACRSSARRNSREAR